MLVVTQDSWSIEIGQEAGIRTRTVRFTGGDAAVTPQAGSECGARNSECGTVDAECGISRARGGSRFHALIHNHPSGDSTPSEPDIKVTRDLIRAGQILKVEGLDYGVIGEPNHPSLRTLGYFL